MHSLHSTFPHSMVCEHEILLAGSSVLFRLLPVLLCPQCNWKTACLFPAHVDRPTYFLSVCDLDPNFIPSASLFLNFLFFMMEGIHDNFFKYKYIVYLIYALSIYLLSCFILILKVNVGYTPFL